MINSKFSHYSYSNITHVVIGNVWLVSLSSLSSSCSWIELIEEDCLELSWLLLDLTAAVSILDITILLFK